VGQALETRVRGLDAAIAQGYQPQAKHQVLQGVMVGGVVVPLDLVAVA
jgi:hypothetical protein